MAVGGLHYCPRCKRRISDKAWLQGICLHCGLDFGRMEVDALGDEIERQELERHTRAPDPLVCGGLLGAVAFGFLCYLRSYGRGGFRLDNATFFLAVVPGMIVAFGAWLAARVAQRRRWSKLRKWMAAVLGALGLVALIILLFLVMANTMRLA